jgi:acetyl esterase/lipase
MFGARLVFLAIVAINPVEVLSPPNDTAVELDIPYADGDDAQKLDLYLPAQRNFPTIVFTYGGGWRGGSRKSVAPIGQKLQSHGYGCALLSHRLGPQNKFPAQVEDVAAGFAWVKRHIQEKGGDPKRVFLMGHSSGAHLSLLVAADPKYLSAHGLAPTDIAGVIGLSTPTDLAPREDKRGFGDILLARGGADVFSRDIELMKTGSPVAHASNDLPPTLLVVGERDFPMLEADAKVFAVKAKASGAIVRTSVAKGCDHMGVVRNLIEDKSLILEWVRDFVRDPKARD